MVILWLFLKIGATVVADTWDSKLDFDQLNKQAATNFGTLVLSTLFLELGGNKMA